MATGTKRTVGIGMDYSATSKAAVRWAVDNLIRAGDRMVLIHVLPKSDDRPLRQLWEDEGSRSTNEATAAALIPLEEFKEMNLPVRYGIKADSEVLDLLDAWTDRHGTTQTSAGERQRLRRDLRGLPGDRREGVRVALSIFDRLQRFSQKCLRINDSIMQFVACLFTFCICRG